jgi:myotubularin-related protein 6/7/8
MVGIKAKRSIQDEKLIESIFRSHLSDSTHLAPPASTPSSSNSSTSTSPKNYIIDARPMGNAMANRAMGAGTESTEHYRDCERLFMNIDNIHVMRDSLAKLVEGIESSY